MKDRIKELSLQCWEERKYAPAWFNHEKFAQLIIQECLLALEPNLYESDIEFRVDLAFHKKCQRIINKYFEIE